MNSTNLRNSLLTALLLFSLGAQSSAQNYEYDSAGRLIRVAYPAGGGVSYDYDATDNLIDVFPLNLPAAPANVGVERRSDTEAQVTWDSVPGAQGYVIERRLTGSNQWVEIARVSGSVRTYIDPDIEDGRQYSYRVAAISTDGLSAFSEEGSTNPVSEGLRLLIAAGGAGTISTTGESAQQRTGYAKVNVNSGGAPYGISVFSFTANGVITSEAGVPASPPSRHTRVFIDYRNNVALSTPQSTGTISVTTGIGVANTGPSDADIKYTLRDTAGNTLATGNGTLGAGLHFARVINDFQSVAPDFQLPGNFPTAVGFGSLDIESDNPISVMAIRGTTNQRGELLLTTTPVADLDQAANSNSVFFPHLADSQGFTTFLFLVNPTASPQRGLMEVFGDAGTPLSITPAGGSPAAVFPYTVPPNGIFVFESDGSAATHLTGWVRLTPLAGDTAPVGAGAFQSFKNGILVSESGIPAAIPTTLARIYVDKSGGHDNGVALAVPGGAASNLAVKAYQLDGSTSAGGGSTSFSLNSGGHRAGLANAFVPGLPDGFRGVFEISSDTPFVALNLRALINQRGDLLLTTFPIADMNRPAPAPVVFPHFADGGGFQTELILQSPGGAVTVTVEFVADDGNPVSVEEEP